MTGSDRLRMKKTPKNHEAHSWKKRGEPFTDQTDGGGRGFTHKVLRVETQQPGSSTHYVIFQSLYKPPHHVSFLVEFCITDPEEGLSIRPKCRKIDRVFKLVH